MTLEHEDPSSTYFQGVVTNSGHKAAAFLHAQLWFLRKLTLGTVLFLVVP